MDLDPDPEPDPDPPFLVTEVPKHGISFENEK